MLRANGVVNRSLIGVSEVGEDLCREAYIAIVAFV